MAYSYRSSNFAGQLGSTNTCVQQKVSKKKLPTSGPWWVVWSNVKSSGYKTLNCTDKSDQNRYTEAEAKAIFPRDGGEVNPTYGTKGNSYRITSVTEYTVDYVCNNKSYTCVMYQIPGFSGYLSRMPTSKDPYACWSTASNVINRGERPEYMPASRNPCVYSGCNDVNASNYMANEACRYADCEGALDYVWVFKDWSGTYISHSYTTLDRSQGCQPRPRPTNTSIKDRLRNKLVSSEDSNYRWELERKVEGCADPSFANWTNYNPNATVHNFAYCGKEKVAGCTDPNFLEFNPNAYSSDQSKCRTRKVVGCGDPEAENYDAQATWTDPSMCRYFDASKVQGYLEETMKTAVPSMVSQVLLEYSNQGIPPISRLPEMVDKVLAKIETYLCQNYEYIREKYDCPEVVDPYAQYYQQQAISATPIIARIAEPAKVAQSAVAKSARSASSVARKTRVGSRTISYDPVNVLYAK